MRIVVAETESVKNQNINEFTFKRYIMKSLIKKKSAKVNAKPAQCCAKTSKTIVGCHD
jgi:hypothetical protein